jgi:hypothetical protein
LLEKVVANELAGAAARHEDVQKALQPPPDLGRARGQRGAGNGEGAQDRAAAVTLQVRGVAVKVEAEAAAVPWKEVRKEARGRGIAHPCPVRRRFGAAVAPVAGSRGVAFDALVAVAGGRKVGGAGGGAGARTAAQRGGLGGSQLTERRGQVQLALVGIVAPVVAAAAEGVQVEPQELEEERDHLPGLAEGEARAGDQAAQDEPEASL